MATAISEDVLDVLRNSTIHDDRIVLPPGQLERSLYTKVDKVLKAHGGKWNTKLKAHLVPSDSIQEIRNVIDSGKYVDVLKENAFFPTPEQVADELVQLANIDQSHSILEPSAGKGNIVKAILKRIPNARIAFCEIHKPFQDEVAALGADFITDDFLTIDKKAKFDRIVANPPFNKQLDIKHVNAMLDVLKPGGILVSVMSGSVTFRDDKLTIDFHNRLNDIGSFTITPLPEGAFKESGTMVNSVILRVEKN